MSRSERTAQGTPKTNAARALDALSIIYDLRSYEVDEADLTAASVARKIGLPAEQVFKTLVVRAASGNHLFAIIPGNAEVDLKKLAAAAGEKRCELAPLKEVEPLTGYVRGGVTVLAARKAFLAIADESIELYDQISVSAGQRGLQLVLVPGEYLRATKCLLADLIKGPVKVSNGQ